MVEYERMMPEDRTDGRRPKPLERKDAALYVSKFM